MSDLRSLLDDLASDDRRRVAAACRTLGERGTRQAVRPLIRRLAPGEEPSIRRLAALALGAIGDPSALEALELTPASNAPHEPVVDLDTVFGRAASTLRDTLNTSGRRADLRRLVRALHHEDPSVVRRCQSGLADWGEYALKALRPLLTADDEQLRLRALLAAEQIRRAHPSLREAVVTLLLPRIDDPSPVVRRQVPLSLRYQHDPRLVARLIPRLRDPEPSVRLQAMLALETLDAFEAIPEIARLAANDPTELGPQVRIDHAAASVLRTLRRRAEERRG